MSRDRNTAPMRLNETCGALQSQEAQSIKTRIKVQQGFRCACSCRRMLLGAWSLPRSRTSRQVQAMTDKQGILGEEGGRLKIDFTASGKSRYFLKFRCWYETLSEEDEAETWSPSQMPSKTIREQCGTTKRDGTN